MVAINDPIVLRFTFSDQEDEVIAPAQLSGVVGALQTYFEDVTSALGPHRAQLLLVASPAKGSLDFFFRARFTDKKDQTEIILLVNDERDRKDVIRALAAYASIGAFLWVVIFGGRGLLDFISGKEEAASRIETIEQNARETVRDLLTDKPASRVALIQAARETGAIRVEIQLPDEPLVVIFDKEVKPKGTNLGLRRQLPTSSDLGNITLVEKSPVASVRFKGKPYRMYLGSARLKKQKNFAQIVPVLLLFERKPIHGAAYHWARANEVTPVEGMLPQEFAGARAVLEGFDPSVSQR